MTEQCLQHKFLSYIWMYSYICIIWSDISSWNSNTSRLQNRPGCCLLSFSFSPVLNTQFSMLLGNPWGPDTFVPDLRGCLSLGTGWQPPACLGLDKQHVTREMISVFQREGHRLPSCDWCLVGERLASVVFILSRPWWARRRFFLKRG